MSVATRRTLHSGPPGYPFLGHVPEFLRDKLGFLSMCAAGYGDVVRLHIGEPTFLLNNADDVKHVFVTNPDNYDKTPRMVTPRGKRLSGAGLLTSLGPDHLRQRLMLQPVFYRKSIESFGAMIARTLEDRLAGWKSGMELDVADDMMSLAQTNIIRTVFGMSFNDAGGKLAAAVTVRRQYMEHVFFSLFPFPEYLPTPIVWAYRTAMQRIDETIYCAIRERRQANALRQDLLSSLLRVTYEDGTRMTDTQVHDEALTLLITGYETIGEALAWTWYLLASHADVEANVLTELREVLDGRTPAVEDVGKLRYTGMVLAESMRLYPPTWIVVRMARHDDVLPSGVMIPAGSKLYLCQYVMHRNPRYFPDPERFNPERFSEEAKKQRPPFAYFPFGGGARVCIGESFAKMQGILVLAAVAQRFKLRLVSGQQVVPEPKMTLRPRNGLRVRVERR